MKRVVFAVALAVVVSSCSSVPEAPADDAQLVEGQQIYARSCASCHGASGQGGTGARLAGTVGETYPDIDDQMAVIAEGRNAMPPFGGRLSAEEIEAVARYTREVLTGE